MTLEYTHSKPLTNFLYALKAPETRRQYPKRLEVFLNFINLHGDLNEKAIILVDKANESPQWLEENLMNFILFQKERVERGEITNSTISNYYKATKLFCEMNNIIINWKKITKGIPKGRHSANDRAPTIEEIRKVVGYPDRRMKAIIYTIASSGIRIGAWDYLKWKHITPIRKDGEIVAAKMVVYAGDAEEYFTFITSEAYNALKDWMDFRAEYGEIITGQSWLMRDIWQTTNMNYGAKFGLATSPKKLDSAAITRMLNRALWEQGLRKQLSKGEKRHEWKAAHGFRKFFKTRAEQVMKPLNVEILMGHDIGINGSYYKPTETELMEDYLKAVEFLSINQDNNKLTKKVDILMEENKNKDFIIKGKLEEKDKQMETLIKRQEQMDKLLQSLIDKGVLNSQ